MDTILQRIMEIEGVTGVLLAGKDGLVVASTLEGDDAELLGAMAAASFDASGRYIEQLGMGEMRHILFETPGGTVQVSDGGDLLVIVRAARQSSIGRIRIEAGQAALHLSEQMGAY